MPIRFALSGLLGNVFFVVVYNVCLGQFQTVLPASTIYAVVQFLCIIVNHLLNCGLVFGWPCHYVKSLAQNMPVGLSALVLGAVCMNGLDRMQFDTAVERLVGIPQQDTIMEEEEEKKGFYASLVVMTITGLYSYVALNIVNKPSPAKVEKEKEL